MTDFCKGSSAMEVVRGYHNLKSRHQGCVATIGNFDGVHLGHQAVVSRMADLARSMGLPSVLITFEPQPQEYFGGSTAPARLTRLREKLEALRGLDLDRVLLLRFTRSFSALTADQFVHRILIDGLGIRHLIVGDDFRFGRGREGDFDLLTRLGGAHGYSVEGISTFEVDGARVSSTRIREALGAGDFATTRALLGRTYRLCGRVVYGDQRGRTIGFPTANVLLHRRRSPLQGVFAVRAHGLANGTVDGVANVGNRPTVDGGARVVLEIHLFDFDQEIYGRALQVEFCHRLRDEKKFASFDALREQIEVDAAQAREYFG